MVVLQIVVLAVAANDGNFGGGSGSNVGGDGDVGSDDNRNDDGVGGDGDVDGDDNGSDDGVGGGTKRWRWWW